MRRLVAALCFLAGRWAQTQSIGQVEPVHLVLGTSGVTNLTDGTVHFDFPAVCARDRPQPYTIAVRRGRQSRTGDGCRYASDGECDEPASCARGTDSTDCRPDQIEFSMSLFGPNGMKLAETTQKVTVFDNRDDTIRLLGWVCSQSGTYGITVEDNSRRFSRVHGFVAPYSPGDTAVQVHTDSCRYAFDGECDVAEGNGRSYCAAGTDDYDCSSPNSCYSAYDGVCDEDDSSHRCAAGTDSYDCHADSCHTARDGNCDEPRYCAAGTDSSDCGTNCRGYSWHDVADCNHWDPSAVAGFGGWGIALPGVPRDFTFTADRNSSYYISTEGGHGLADNQLSLYSRDNVLLAYNDDVAILVGDQSIVASRSAATKWTCAEAGEYTLRVLAVHQEDGFTFQYGPILSSYGGFILKVELVPATHATAVDPASATRVELAVPVSISGSDARLFALSAVAGTSYAITVHVPDLDEDVIVTLYDSTMRALGMNDETQQTEFYEAILGWVCRSTGLYYVRVEPKKMTVGGQEAASFVLMIEAARSIVIDLDTDSIFPSSLARNDTRFATDIYSMPVQRGQIYTVYTELTRTAIGGTPLADSAIIVVADLDGLASTEGERASTASATQSVSQVISECDDVARYTQKQSYVQWNCTADMTVFIVVRGYAVDRQLGGQYYLHAQQTSPGASSCSENHKFCAQETLRLSCDSDAALRSECPISCGTCQPGSSGGMDHHVEWVGVSATPAITTNHGCRCMPTSFDNDGVSFEGCSSARGGWCNVLPELTEDGTPTNPPAGCAGAQEASGRIGGYGSLFGWDHCAPEADTCKDISVRGVEYCSVLNGLSGVQLHSKCDQKMLDIAVTDGMGISSAKLLPSDLLKHYCPRSCSMCTCPTTNNGVCDEGWACAYTTDAADCFCRYEDDGVCDAGSRCRDGTDITDCACDSAMDGMCDEGDSCPYGSDSADCCLTTADTKCDEKQFCPRGSDRIDCYCPSAGDGFCNEADGSCPLFSDLRDCSPAVISARDKHPICPLVWVNDDFCDENSYCYADTDVKDCTKCDDCPAGGCLTVDCVAEVSPCTEHEACRRGSEYCAYSKSPFASWCRKCDQRGDGFCYDHPASVTTETDVTHGCDVCYKNDMCSCHAKGHTVWHFHAFDSYGDGWNGMEFKIYPAGYQESGEAPILIGKPERPHGGTPSVPAFLYPVCVPDPNQCYVVEVAGGSTANEYAAEVTWQLLAASDSQRQMLEEVCRHGEWQTSDPLLRTDAGQILAAGSVGRFVTSLPNQRCSTVSPCAAGRHDIEVVIRPDQYPHETSWTLVNLQNSSELSVQYSLCPEDGVRAVGSGACAKVPASGNIKYSFCVPNGTYRFAMYDSFGDGLCCEWAYGGFAVKVDGQWIKEGGAFRNLDAVTFVVDPDGTSAEVPDTCLDDRPPVASASGNGTQDSSCNSHTDCTDGLYCDATHSCWNCSAIQVGWCDVVECAPDTAIQNAGAVIQAGVDFSYSYSFAVRSCKECCSPSFLSHCPPHKHPAIEERCVEVKLDCSGQCTAGVESVMDGICDQRFNCKSQQYDQGDCVHDWGINNFAGGLAFVYAGDPVFALLSAGHSWGLQAEGFLRAREPLDWDGFDPCVPDSQESLGNWTVCATRNGHLSFEYQGLQQLFIDTEGDVWDRAAGGVLYGKKVGSPDDFNLHERLLPMMTVGHWKLAVFSGYLGWFYDPDLSTQTAQAMMVMTRQGDVWSRKTQGYLQRKGSKVSVETFFVSSRTILSSDTVAIDSSGSYAVWSDGALLGGGNGDYRTFRFTGDCQSPLLIAVAAEGGPGSADHAFLRMQINWCKLTFYSGPEWKCSAAAQTNRSWHTALDFEDSGWHATFERSKSSLSGERGKSDNELPIWANDLDTKLSASKIFCRVEFAAPGVQAGRTRSGDSSLIGTMIGTIGTLTTGFSGMRPTTKFVIFAAVGIMLLVVGVMVRHLWRQNKVLKRAPASVEMTERLSSGVPEHKEENMISQMFQTETNDMRQSTFHGTGGEPLEIGEEIGSGAYGVVYKARWGDGVVAVKQLKLTRKEMKMVQKVMAEFRAEVTIMERLDHPNIVAMHGFTMRPRVCIIQEYLVNGDLGSYLRNETAASDLTLEARLNMAIDTASGMEYLHSLSPPVIHRDLKSPNLLLDSAMRVKITDFGLARAKAVTEERTQVMTTCGTPYWTAPEILLGKVYNESVDTYSYGMVLWELWKCETPFQGMAAMEVAVQVASGKLKPDIPPCPDVFGNLMSRCWSHDSEERPRFSEVVAEFSTWAEFSGVLKYPPAEGADRSALPHRDGGELEIHNTDRLLETPRTSANVNLDSRASSGSSDSSGSRGVRLARNLFNLSRLPGATGPTPLAAHLSMDDRLL